MKQAYPKHMGEIHLPFTFSRIGRSRLPKEVLDSFQVHKYTQRIDGLIDGEIYGQKYR